MPDHLLLHIRRKIVDLANWALHMAYGQAYWPILGVVVTTTYTLTIKSIDDGDSGAGMHKLKGGEKIIPLSCGIAWT